MRDGLAFGLLVAAGLFLGAAVGLSCYDTTKPTPPCSVNSPNPGCPDWPHDMHGAGGR